MVCNSQMCLQAGQYKQAGHRLDTPALVVIYLFMAYFSTESSDYTPLQDMINK